MNPDRRAEPNPKEVAGAGRAPEEERRMPEGAIDFMDGQRDPFLNEPVSACQHVGQHNAFPHDLMGEVTYGIKQSPDIECYTKDFFDPQRFIEELEKRSERYFQPPALEDESRYADEFPFVRYTYNGICGRCERRILDLLCLPRVLEMKFECYTIPTLCRTIKTDCTWDAKTFDEEDLFEKFPWEIVEERLFPSLFVFHFPTVNDRIYWAVRKDAVESKGMKGHFNWLFMNACPNYEVPFPEVEYERPKRITLKDPIKSEAELLTDPYAVKTFEAAVAGEPWAIEKLSSAVETSLFWENRMREEVDSRDCVASSFIEFGQDWVISRLSETLEKDGLQQCLRIPTEYITKCQGCHVLESVLFFQFKDCPLVVACQKSRLPDSLFEAIEKRFFAESKTESLGPLVFTGIRKKKQNLVLLGETEILLTDARFCVLLAAAVKRLQKGPGTLSYDQMEKWNIGSRNTPRHSYYPLRDQLRRYLTPEGIDPERLLAHRHGEISLTLPPEDIRVEAERLGRHPDDIVRALVSRLPRNLRAR